MSEPRRPFAEHLDRDRLVERLAALVKAESENPPGREKVAAEVAAGFCEELGLDVSFHEPVPDRPSVLARWKGGDGPTLTYCSHIDVVPAGDRSLWERDPYAAEIADGMMFGRGTSDAKGPCAASLEAVAMLKASGFTFDGTLELALVADEESGGFSGASVMVEDGTLKPDVAIVGEPTQLKVVRAQRGIAWLKVTTHGVAAHGSAPERGVSAIRHMAAVIPALEEHLPDINHELLGGPTINVGTISGGEKLNIIPASCTIEVDRRMIPGETEETMLDTIQAALDAAKEKFPELDARIEVVSIGYPFEVSADARVVQEAVAAVKEVTGTEAEVVGFRGASDARFLADTGCDVIVSGPGDITVAHTAREFIELDELADGALAYASTFARLLG